MSQQAEKTVKAARLGWREWVSLTDWDVAHVKAKVDTGARTSSLHAFAMQFFERDGADWVRFEVHPWQRSSGDGVVVEERVIERRDVKSSSGEAERRPVVATRVEVAGKPIEIELTLTSRDQMGFRMLLGRQALRKRFVVDPAASYLGGRPTRDVRRQNRRAS